MKQPTFIFVHGAWHGAQAWEKVISALEPQGYKCIAPQMLFSGTDEPIHTLYPCFDQLADIISAETSAGNDVIMVGHSFGGVSASSSVKGFTAKDPSKLKSKDSGKVIGIALMTAMVVPTGTNYPTTYAEGEPNSESIGAPGADGWTDLVKDPREIFYEQLPEGEATKWVAALKKQSFATLIAVGGIYAGWLDVPLWYLICGEDVVFSGPFQQRMITTAKDLGAKVEIRRSDAGHSPMLSRVDDTVKFLDEAAKALEQDAKR